MTNKENPNKSFALFMTLIAWVLLFVGVGYLFSLQDRHERSQNQNTVTSINGETKLELTMNRDTHYEISGTINGVPCVFLVDTGATYVSVPLSLANEAGMVQGRTSQSSTANGIINVYNSAISTLTLGPFRLKDVPAVINPSENTSTILLGMSAIKRFVLTQSDRKLTLSIEQSTPEPQNH